MAKKEKDDADAQARSEAIAKAMASIGDTKSYEGPEASKVDFKASPIQHKQAKTDTRHRGLLRSAAKRRIAALKKPKKRTRGRRIKV